MQHAEFSFAGQNVIEALAAEGFKFGVVDIEGEGLLGGELDVERRRGAPGDRLVDEQLPSRTITVTYTLEVDSKASHDALVKRGEVEQLLNGVLHQGRGLQQLEFSHLDGYFEARLASVPTPVRYAQLLQGSIEFFCPQPFRYGDEQTVSPSGGTVAINSNHYVEPVILWELSSSVGAAWVEVDGKRLTIDTGISSGQQVRIDCARMETRIGGVLNVENIDGTYPRVRDGSTIETSPGGTLSLTYQERWI